MPTRTETNRYKWPDDELHLIRVEPVAFRGSAHAPEPAVEPADPAVTNRELPEAVEPPERTETALPEAVEPPERTDVPAPEAVEPPERGELVAPEAVEPPERPEIAAPEQPAEAALSPEVVAPETIDLFGRAWERVERLEDVRRAP